MKALVCMYVWLVATIYMTGMREPMPAAAIAFAVGLVAAVGISMHDSSHRNRLTRRYAWLYGVVPPTGDIKGTRYGAAAGALAGHYVAGAVAGMVVDALRESSQRVDVTTEQRRMLDEIRIARADATAGIVAAFGFALFVSAVVAYV